MIEPTTTPTPTPSQHPPISHTRPIPLAKPSTPQHQAVLRKPCLNLTAYIDATDWQDLADGTYPPDDDIIFTRSPDSHALKVLVTITRTHKHRRPHHAPR